MIIKFLMEGIEGESVASTRVTTRVFNQPANRLRSRALAGRETAGGAKGKGKGRKKKRADHNDTRGNAEAMAVQRQVGGWPRRGAGDGTVDDAGGTAGQCWLR